MPDGSSRKDGASQREALLEDLKRRLDAAADDPQRRARLLVEQGLALEASDAAGARRAFEAAARENPDLLGAVREARRVSESSLDWIEREKRLVATDAERAELLVERGRALALATRHEDAIESYDAALRLAADHPDALAGLETSLLHLARATGDAAPLAAHHARLAHAFASDKRLAALHHVLRARIFERAGDDAAAESAYADALVERDDELLAREGLARVLLRRGSYARLRELILEDESRTEHPYRRARLLYVAARISTDRLDDDAGAVERLKRASSFAPTEPRFDARVLEELVRLLEDQGDTHGAAEVRRKLIDLEPIATVRAIEERRLAADLEVLSDPLGAVTALQAARAIEPLDDLALATLDRLLATLGRDDERLGSWISEATRPGDPARSARAYVRAATIADGALGRSDDALRMARTAWATKPGDEDALDASVRLLLRDAITKDPERLRAACDLLVHAAEMATDPPLRVAHLEKAASIAEDLDPERAAELYERVLAVAPNRRFALVALQRALHRAGDFAGLARVLEREAEQSADEAHASELRLRAAVLHRDRANGAERALALFRRVLDAKPDHEGALFELLATHESLGRAEESLATLERLIAVRGPKFSTTPLRLAAAELASRRLGRIDDAITSWRSVLKDDPEHPVARRDLARALRKRRRWAEAIEATAVVDPVLAAELTEGSLGDDHAAKTMWKRALASAPDDPSAREGLARVAERQKDFGVLAELRAGDARALGELHARAGDDATAARELASLPSLPSMDLADVLTRLEATRRTDPSGAFDDLGLLTRATTDVRARLAAHWERFRARGALEDARALRELSPRSIAALDALDSVATRAESPDDRIAALEAALPLDRDASVRHVRALRLAALLEARKDDARALGLLRQVIAEDPRSPTAIAGMLRLGARVDDAAAMLEGERLAAEIALDPQDRVRHLLAAATLARASGDESAWTYVERALQTEPDSEPAAAAATQLLLGKDPAQLLVVLERAAFAAKKSERVVALAREAATVADALNDPAKAGALLERARSVDPRNVAVLVELGEALKKQGAWPSALAALEAALASGSEKTHRDLLLRAHRAIADLHEGPLADPLRTLVELRAVVRLDPQDVASQRRLARVLGRQGQPVEADEILTKLVEHGTLPMAERLAMLEQISAIRLAHHDKPGAERALRDAVKLEPLLGSDAWKKMEAFHKEHLRGDESLAETLNELVMDGAAPPSWLLELAEIELRLGRERGAIMHLRMAIRMLPEAVEPHVALANALLSVADFDEAAKVLDGLAARDPIQPEVLAARERALTGMSAEEDALVVAELRAWLGQGDDPNRFRARGLPALPPRAGILDHAMIIRYVAPRDTPKGALEVLHVLGSVAAKIAPAAALTAFGLSAKDKLAPKSAHPLRVAVDRYTAALGGLRVDAYVHELRDVGVASEPTDPPAIFFPSWFGSIGDVELAYGVARALARLTLGAQVLDKLGPEGAVAAIAGAIAPYGGTLPVTDDAIAKRVQKALGRDQKKLLEVLAPQVERFEAGRLQRAVEQTAIRVGWLLVPDLASALTHVRRSERIHVQDLGKPHTSTGDLIRFALGTDVTNLRRRLGTVWTES